MLVSQHNITTTNFVIEGETARGEIYCLVFHTFAGPKHYTDVIIGGRYLDTYTKHDGHWKFSQRTIVADWAYQNDPSQVNFDHPSIQGSLRGRPGQTDPSTARTVFVWADEIGGSARGPSLTRLLCSSSTPGCRSRISTSCCH